jgi:hypothetical protein
MSAPIEHACVKIDCNAGVMGFPTADMNLINSTIALYGQSHWGLVSAVPMTDARGATHQIILFFKREQ